ncbi:alpha-hydroxy acid oxidase [Phenylobacterium sp. LjRoot225]|uniref:alpha-hydroxy acid oxidase n=1 Tax=Phenylobacterium sp. LjRoot225 TaxID=3342285 RepID=UPI003ED08872
MKPAHNIWDLRTQAQRRLPRAVFEFIERGSEDETLVRQNRDGLERIKFSPRTLRDVSSRDQTTTLFGRPLPTPMIIAPTGTADLLCYRGERAIARAAGAAGIPFTLATSSTTSVEQIAEATGAGFWMQLYLWDRRDLSWQLVERAGAAGAEAMVLTVDTPMWPNREFNKRNGMANPIRPNPTLARHFLGRPAWLAAVMGRYALEGGIPQFANYPTEAVAGGARKVNRQANSAAVTWDDIVELRRRWPKTLILKGVLSREDALLAIEHGVDGVIVSNHGARNFDASPASIDVLPEIVDAVGERMTVIFDSGVRRGSDVLKAIAIGAKAVMIGRATLYGAAAGGQEGAARAIAILQEEISTAMAMLGVTSLDQLDRSCLRRATVVGLD